MRISLPLIFIFIQYIMVNYGLISSESENGLPNSHPCSLPETLPETDPNMAAASALMCLGRCEDRIMLNKPYEDNGILSTLPSPKLPQAFAAAARPGSTALAHLYYSNNEGDIQFENTKNILATMNSGAFESDIEDNIMPNELYEDNRKMPALPDTHTVKTEPN